MIDPKTGQPDPDHPHVKQLAQVRPEQLRGLAAKLDEISDGLYDAASSRDRMQARSLTGGGVPAWLVDLYNKFGPIVVDMLRAYFLREAGVDIGAGSLQAQQAVAANPEGIAPHERPRTYAVDGGDKPTA